MILFLIPNDPRTIYNNGKSTRMLALQRYGPRIELGPTRRPAVTSVRLVVRWTIHGVLSLQWLWLHSHTIMTPTSSIQRQYDELVAAIVKAVPEIIERPKVYCEVCDEWSYRDEAIRLEDVLRAVREARQKDVHTQATGKKMYFKDIWGEGLDQNTPLWHLGLDLAWHRDNAPETITFLHSLLCV